MNSDKPEPSDDTRLEEIVKRSAWKVLADLAKYTAVIAIVFFSLRMVYQKVSKISFAQVMESIANIPPSQLALAIAIMGLNFFVLTGYDWIAVTYLKKKVSLSKIMIGAIIGYAFSNIVGWMLGGTAVRYRLYRRWGFSFMDIVAFISLLSVTFWLGMFLLAGIAFVLLPVRLPAEYQEHLYFSPQSYGYAFLFIVLLYLLATLVIRKPIKIGGQEFAFPPFSLSILQLVVSAADFALASLVLYILLPPGTANYSTVLVSYLAAMIVTVTLHVPGGFGVLELIVLEMLTKEVEKGAVEPLIVSVTCGLILFRVIYYFVPGIIAFILLLFQEILPSQNKQEQRDAIAENI